MLRIAMLGLAASLMLASAPSGAVPFSFLIGKWVLAKGECAVVAVEFKPYAMVEQRASGTATAEASYKNATDRRAVYVTGTAGTTSYLILDDNHVAVEDATKCVYERAK